MPPPENPPLNGVPDAGGEGSAHLAARDAWG